MTSETLPLTPVIPFEENADFDLFLDALLIALLISVYLGSAISPSLNSDRTLNADQISGVYGLRVN